MSNFYDAPLTYKTLINLDKMLTIRQEFKLVNNEVVKLDIPKYGNKNDDLLLLIIRGYRRWRRR